MNTIVSNRATVINPTELSLLMLMVTQISPGIRTAIEPKGCVNAPRVESHRIEKTATIREERRNTAWTRRKKRRELSGRATAANQQITWPTASHLYSFPAAEDFNRQLPLVRKPVF